VENFWRGGGGAWCEKGWTVCWYVAAFILICNGGFLGRKIGSLITLLTSASNFIAR